MNWKEQVDELVPRLRENESGQPWPMEAYEKVEAAADLIEELAGHLDLLDSVARGHLSNAACPNTGWVDQDGVRRPAFACPNSETYIALEDTLRFLDGVSDAPPEYEQVGWKCEMCDWMAPHTADLSVCQGRLLFARHHSSTSGVVPLYTKRGT